MYIHQISVFIENKPGILQISQTLLLKIRLT